MDWIMSGGGPLICMESADVPTWRGIDGLSLQVSDAITDYERACQSKTYTASVPVVGGNALVLTMGALDTSVWKLPSGATCIVSIDSADPGIDEPTMLALMDESIFNQPLGRTEIVFPVGQLAIFDSAASGIEPNEASLRLEVIPGRYAVLAQTFEPDERASFIVYKLLRSTEADEASQN